MCVFTTCLHNVILKCIILTSKQFSWRETGRRNLHNPASVNMLKYEVQVAQVSLWWKTTHVHSTQIWSMNWNYLLLRHLQLTMVYLYVFPGGVVSLMLVDLVSCINVWYTYYHRTPRRCKFRIGLACHTFGAWKFSRISLSTFCSSDLVNKFGLSNSKIRHVPFSTCEHFLRDKLQR